MKPIDADALLHLVKTSSISQDSHKIAYVEWLEEVVAKYQPDWICDELVGSDEWCDNNCKSNWNSECLKRYYARHIDTADIPQTEREGE